MPPLSPRAADWIEPLADAIATATGRRPVVMGVPFGTDAGPLSAAGTPCVVFGPGDIAQAHTKDEWIELEQVQLAAEAYFQIAVDSADTAVASLGSADRALHRGQTTRPRPSSEGEDDRGLARALQSRTAHSRESGSPRFRNDRVLRRRPGVKW